MSAFLQSALGNKQMAFLVTEIAMELMGYKYFDTDGLQVSDFEKMVKQNKAGFHEPGSLETLDQFLANEVFYNQSGAQIEFNTLSNFEPVQKPKEIINRSSYPPHSLSSNAAVRPAVPRISSARSLVQPVVTSPTATKPQQTIPVRRPSFSSQFNTFVTDQEKKAAEQQPQPQTISNKNSSLFQRSMTQIGLGKKIIIKPKPLPKGVSVITVPAKIIPAPRITVSHPRKLMPKVVSVRPPAPTPIISGGSGTQFKGPAPIVSGGVGTQYRSQPSNEPAPAVSGGGGTQFGGPSGILPNNNDLQPSAPKVSRILQRRKTLFHKQPF